MDKPTKVVSLSVERAKRDANPKNWPENGRLELGPLEGHPGCAVLRIVYGEESGEEREPAFLDPDTLSDLLDMLWEIESEGPNAREGEDE